jgi:hypothetical protein
MHNGLNLCLAFRHASMMLLLFEQLGCEGIYWVSYQAYYAKHDLGSCGGGPALFASFISFKHLPCKLPFCSTLLFSIFLAFSSI